MAMFYKITLDDLRSGRYAEYMADIKAIEAEMNAHNGETGHDDFRGYWGMRDGQPFHSWDYEEAIGEID